MLAVCLSGWAPAPVVDLPRVAFSWEQYADACSLIHRSAIPVAAVAAGAEDAFFQSQGDAAGTFGRALAATPIDQLIGSGERRRIIFMSEDGGIRANVGCINGTDSPLEIMLELYDAGGDQIDSETINLGAWGNYQINRILQPFAPTNGYVDVSSDDTGALFYCYGSVLDNQTSDPTTILPQ